MMLVERVNKPTQNFCLLLFGLSQLPGDLGLVRGDLFFKALLLVFGFG